MEGGVPCAVSVAKTAAAAATAASPTVSAGAYDPAGALGLDVEPHVEHVAVLDDVRLALETLLAGARRLRVAAGLCLEEVRELRAVIEQRVSSLPL